MTPNSFLHILLFWLVSESLAQQTLSEALRDLVSANHILHYNGVLDGYGQVAIRHPQEPEIYILSETRPAGLVSSEEDFGMYWINTSSPVDSSNNDGESVCSERFIHGEIMKRFPDVGATIDSHAASVLPFTTSRVPLLPVYHMAAFLGSYVPNWDITLLYTSTDEQDMLVKNTRLGAGLAAAFVDNSTTRPGDRHAVVLQKQRGFSTAAKSIQAAVYQAVYTSINAGIERDQIMLRDAFAETFQPGLKLFALDTKQLVNGAERAEKQSIQAWASWRAQVEASSLYKNVI